MKNIYKIAKFIFRAARIETLKTLDEALNAIKRGTWNGKFYGNEKYGWKIYISNQEYSLSSNLIDELKAYIEQKTYSNFHDKLKNNSNFYKEIHQKIFDYIDNELFSSSNSIRRFLSTKAQKYLIDSKIELTDEIKKFTGDSIISIENVLTHLKHLKVASVTEDLINLIDNNYWNEKFYGSDSKGYSIYISNKPYPVTLEQKEKLTNHLKEKKEKKVHKLLEDTKTVPNTHLEKDIKDFLKEQTLEYVREGLKEFKSSTGIKSMLHNFKSYFEKFPKDMELDIFEAIKEMIEGIEKFLLDKVSKSV